MGQEQNSFLFIQKIIDSVPLGIYLKDINNNILITNKYYCDYFKNQIIQNNKDFPTDEYSTYSLDSRKIYFKNGNATWQKVIKIPFFDEYQTQKYFLVIFMDTNNEKKLQEQKDTSTAILSHDLKTPISAQITAINLLLDKTFGNLTESQENILKQIKNSCNYTKDIANNILDTYLYENGQIKIEPEEFYWKNFIDEIIKETKSLAHEKSQQIINFSDFSDTEIVADKFQLKRVIINLLSNAIKYGNRNSKIEIITQINDYNLLFRIKSFSKYIKKEDISEIYEKFQTCNTTSGSGLGLYLVKQVIESHNGYVFATSEKNGECTFGFAIPQKIRVKTK